MRPNSQDAIRLAERFRMQSVLDLTRTVPCDRIIWGVQSDPVSSTKADKSGSVRIDIAMSRVFRIDDGELIREPADLLQIYNNHVRHFDVVGRLFSAMPKVVQVIDVAAARPTRDAAELWRYLAEHKIAHLILIGTSSEFGLTWLTLYRDAASKNGAQFTERQVSYASRQIPLMLYRWQLIFAGYATESEVNLDPEHDKPCSATTSELSNTEMITLLGFMDGLSASKIASQLHDIEGEKKYTANQVSKYHSSARAKLELSGRSGLGVLGGNRPF